MRIKNQITGGIVNDVSPTTGYNRVAGWRFVDNNIKNDTVKLYGQEWEEIKEYVNIQIAKDDFDQINTIGGSLAVLFKDAKYHVVPFITN